MNDSLRISLEAAPIIFKGKYPYLLHPLFDGFPSIQPVLLNDVVCEMEKMIKPFLPVDKMITVEAMGIPIATVLSQKMDMPLMIIRKRRYGLLDEICVKQQTGYASSSLYVNGINKGETIIFIDDIISTGGTFHAIIDSLRSKQVNIKAGFFIIDKGTLTQKLSEETNIPIHSLLRISIENDRVRVHE